MRKFDPLELILKLNSIIKNHKKIKKEKNIMSDTTFYEVFNEFEEYYNKKYTTKQLTINKRLLNHLTDTQIRTYADKLLKEYVYITLPKASDILKYEREEQELKKEQLEALKIEKYTKIKKYIEQMVQNGYKKYICDEPLAHVVIEDLGGLAKLGQSTKVSFEVTMNTTLKEIINKIMFKKIDKIPITIGNYENNYLTTIGDINEITKWLNAYAKKIGVLGKDEYKNNIEVLVGLLQSKQNLLGIKNNLKVITM